MVLIFLVVVCIVFGGILFAVFSGLFSDDSSGYSFGGGGGGIPRFKELPAGCFVALIAFGTVWFLLWGVVLVLALRLLNTPLGS